MVPQAPLAWKPLAAAAAVSVALTGVIGWRLNLQSIEAQIAEKRTSLKRLVLSGSIPPNQEVMNYFSARQASLAQRYREWLTWVAAPPLADAAKADPQLYFQEQLHEVQRTIERLATARSVAVPEQLGFPKDLPPSDTVPRLLVQLALVQEAGTLAFEHGVADLTCFKVEDPQPVDEGAEGGAFLTRVPVRVRLKNSLPRLMQLLGALHAAKPLIDLRLLRVQSPPGAELLDVEVVLSRYLVIPNAQEPGAGPSESEATPQDRTPPAPTKPRGAASPNTNQKKR